MPVETTEGYIRITVREDANVQEGSYRTITLSAEQGIKALIGKLEGETKTTVLTYLFDKEKWDLEKAKAWVAEHKETKAMIADLFLAAAYKAAGDREEAQAAQKARASRYNISPKEGGNLTPPKGYPGSDEDYADPVNYRYPIDSAHIRPAVSYFNQDGQREDGGYSEAEWAIVGKRIAARASKLIGEGYGYKGGKVTRGESETKSLAVKTLETDAHGAVVGGYLLLWGAPDERDAQEQFFTKSTELWLDRYPVVPALFHHGLDPQVDLAVIGHRLKAQADDMGVWVQHWIDKSNKYWAWVEALLSGGRLYYSPGSASHLVRLAGKSGEILAYPVVEDTLTPVPANYHLRARPVDRIKATYQSANLAPPDLSGGDAAASRLERARAEALRLSIELGLRKLELTH